MFRVVEAAEAEANVHGFAALLGEISLVMRYEEGLGWFEEFLGVVGEGCAGGVAEHGGAVSWEEGVLG